MCVNGEASDEVPPVNLAHSGYNVGSSDEEDELTQERKRVKQLEAKVEGLERDNELLKRE